MAELETIRAGLAATQERVARVAAAMTARYEMMMALALGPTAEPRIDGPQVATVTAIAEAQIDEALVPLAPVMMAPSDIALNAPASAAPQIPMTTVDEPSSPVAAEASIATSNAATVLTAGSDEALLSTKELDAPATLATDQSRTETENANAIAVASDERCGGAVEAKPVVLIGESRTEQSNDADLPLVSAPAAEPLRAVRPPEALPENGAQRLAPVLATESAADDASMARTATVTAERASAEASVTLLNEGPAAQSDDASSSKSRSDTASVDPLLRSAPVAGETAVQNPSATEAVALGQTQSSQAPQSAASAAATGFVPKSVTAAAVSTPPATAVGNVVALDAARLRASKPVRTKRRRRTGMAALLASAAAFAAVVVTAGLYDLGKDFQIDRMTEIFSTAG